MNTIEEALPFLVPVVIIHLILVSISLRDIFKYAQFKLIGKIIWPILIIYMLVTGPILYLFYGRGERSWAKIMTDMQKQAHEQIKNDQNGISELPDQ